MNDEIFDRTYQAGRADFNASMDRADAAIGNGLRNEIGKSLAMLHRLEWSAPWAAPSAPRRKHNRARAA